MSTSVYKLSFLNQRGSEYLTWKYRNDPTSMFHNAPPGMWVGFQYCNDFLTRRWFHNMKRILMDPTNVLFFGAAGAITSDSNTPKGVAGDALAHIIMAFLIFMVFALPILAVFILIDLFFMIPYMLVKQHTIREGVNQWIQTKLQEEGKGDVSTVEKELDARMNEFIIELENAASK